MKLKNILLILLCCVCTLGFVGCDKRNVDTNPINMSRYFKTDVTSKYNSNNKKTYQLNSFTGDNVDTSTLELHKSLQFTGITNWINNMYIECVYFYFYSTKTIDINQLVFKMTGLDGGKSDDFTLNTYKAEEILAIKAQKNTGVLVRVNVGHKATLNDLGMTFSLEDESLFSVDFDWTIYGLQVYGEMKK